MQRREGSLSALRRALAGTEGSAVHDLARGEGADRREHRETPTSDAVSRNPWTSTAPRGYQPRSIGRVSTQSNFRASRPAATERLPPPPGDSVVSRCWLVRSWVDLEPFPTEAARGWDQVPTPMGRARAMRTKGHLETVTYPSPHRYSAVTRAGKSRWVGDGRRDRGRSACDGDSR